jgi:tRNA pseudouridine65 synthase
VGGGLGAVEGQAAGFTLLLRDPWLVAVNKPSGMAVHRGWAREGPVALQTVRDAVGCHVHPVHRLDRGASGVLLFALDRQTLAAAAREFAQGGVRKEYLALVRGVPAEELVIDHPLRSGLGDERKAATSIVRRLAVSPRERVSLVLVRPREGRLHQIRRHLKHASHPIVGDVRYGKGELNRRHRTEYGLHRLALHAWALRMNHPRTGEELALIAPIPDDLAGPLARLELFLPASVTA